MTRKKVLHCEVELTGRFVLTDLPGKSKDQRMPSGPMSDPVNESEKNINLVPVNRRYGDVCVYS